MPFWKKNPVVAPPAIIMDPKIARQVLISRGLPSRVLDAIENRQPPFLYLWWSKPNYIFANELTTLAPGLVGLCPFAEQNGEAVFGLLPERDEYITYYYEDGRMGDKGITVVARGYEQFAAGVLLGFEECSLREELLQAAEMLHFKKLPELLRLLDADPYEDDAVEAFLRQLGIAA